MLEKCKDLRLHLQRMFYWQSDMVARIVVGPGFLLFCRRVAPAKLFLNTLLPGCPNILYFRANLLGFGLSAAEKKSLSVMFETIDII